MHKELTNEVYKYKLYLIKHLRDIYIKDILNDLKQVLEIKQKEFDNLSAIDKIFYIYREIEYLHQEIDRLCKMKNI